VATPRVYDGAPPRTRRSPWRAQLSSPTAPAAPSKWASSIQQHLAHRVRWAAHA
jgi:hypothetical protein